MQVFLYKKKLLTALVYWYTYSAIIPQCARDTVTGNTANCGTEPVTVGETIGASDWAVRSAVV